jgi:hypothetical protein
VSLFGPASPFFRKLFSELTVQEESAFDSTCQRLNAHLIKSFASCLDQFDKSESKKKVKFNQALLEFLQSKMFIEVVASSTVTEFCYQLGMCAIATSLWGKLRSLVRNCLPKNNLDALYSEDQKLNFKVEVNSFFGWAISDIHRTLVDELNATEFDVEESVAQARLDFVGRMRYFDHQAAQNKTYYLEECYDGIYRLRNCGGLTLVSPQYFEFGKSLMQVIVNSLGMKHFDIIGSDAVKKSCVYIEKNMESLTSQFLECDERFTAISRKEKEAILDRLVKKTCNA